MDSYTHFHLHTCHFLDLGELGLFPYLFILAKLRCFMNPTDHPQDILGGLSGAEHSTGSIGV